MQQDWKRLFSKERWSQCAKNIFTWWAPEPKSDWNEWWSFKVDSSSKSGWGAPRPSFKWMKKWWYGPVAYLIDFLDPVFLADFVTECKNILQWFAALKKDDNEDYQDAFKLSYIAPAWNLLSSEEDFKNINPNFSKAVWEGGVNSVQINTAINEWWWFLEESANDQAFEFILRYDKNWDGRLDISELMTAVIYHNKRRDWLFCYNCFHLLAKKIWAMFTYLDCQSKWFLTAEELWNKM